MLGNREEVVVVWYGSGGVFQGSLSLECGGEVEFGFEWLIRNKFQVLVIYYRLKKEIIVILYIQYLLSY